MYIVFDIYFSWELARRNVKGQSCSNGPTESETAGMATGRGVDLDAVLVLEVYAKKTRKMPDEVVDRCKQRLQQYDSAVRKAKKKK